MNNDFDTKQRLFGTDGIRGTVNKDKITAQMAVKLAMAAGNYFFGKAGTKKPRVLIGKDTRLSGYMLEPALVSGFTSVGLDAITTGPMPTPAIAHLTRALRCDLGVMISASHNPYEDNGLKLFGSDGFKLNDDVENEIQLKMETNPTLAKSADLGRARRMEDANGRYAEFVKQILPKHEDLSGLKVVLDCANGASYKVGPEVLFELGAEANIIGAEPNGKNINFQCGAMFPERMAEETKLQGADLGIAFDGDADRVIFSDEKGNIIEGDLIIGFLANQMLKLKRKQKQEKDQAQQQQMIQAQAQANMQQSEQAAMNEVEKQQALAQTEIQIEQAKSQFEIQRMEQEALIKKQLMAEEFNYQLQLAQAKVNTDKEKEQFIEDRKDKRTKIQATQQSKMIEQRQNDLLPTDFESAGMDNLGGFGLEGWKRNYPSCPMRMPKNILNPWGSLTRESLH